MLKRLIVLLFTFIMVIGLHVQGADQQFTMAETDDSIIVQYHLVRYSSSTETMYYSIHDRLLCVGLLDRNKFKISNASGFALVAGDMQYGKFDFYEDTVTSEKSLGKFLKHNIKENEYE